MSACLSSIDDTLGTRVINSINIQGVKSTSAGVNALLGSIVKLIDKEHGLKELILSDFPVADEFYVEFDQEILEKLIS